MPAVFAVSSSKGGDSIISWGSLCQCLTILTVSLDSPGHRRAQSVVLILSHQVFAHADWNPLSLPFLQAALPQVHSMQQMFLSLNLLCSPYSLRPKHSSPTAYGEGLQPMSELSILSFSSPFWPWCEVCASGPRNPVASPAWGAPGFPSTPVLPALILGLGL